MKYKIIKSSELKTDTDMVCTHCGINYGERDLNGYLIYVEGIDYVFETNGKDEWCICMACKEYCDRNGLK